MTLTTYPVTDDSMNYTSAAIGVIALIALGTWVSTGRKHFTGPAGGAASQGMVVETGKVVEDVEPEGISAGMEKKG